MKNKGIFVLTLLSVFLFSLCAHAEVTLTGAGASFPAPVYAKWADSYNKEMGVNVNYQAIGSSGGIKQINANTVDFGASDSPLTETALKEQGLFQFPTVIGGIVVAVNVKGVKPGELILDGKTLGDIYLGKITKWNDKAIVALNPELSLPDQMINVIRRADGSGTSFVFTSYLSKVNETWKKDIGIGTTVKWATGIGGKGNDGVAAFIQRLAGSIGYVEYTYAKQNNLAYTRLYSADQKVVSPSETSFRSAALLANWEESFAQDLTNQPGDNAWPITSTTYILMKKESKDIEKSKEVIKFFDWAFEKGEKEASSLDYATLPELVIKQIKAHWADGYIQ